MNSFNVTIGQDKKQVFINVYYNNIRYRFWNGKAIEIKLNVSTTLPYSKLHLN